MLYNFNKIPQVTPLGEHLVANHCRFIRTAILQNVATFYSYLRARASYSCLGHSYLPSALVNLYWLRSKDDGQSARCQCFAMFGACRVHPSWSFCSTLHAGVKFAHLVGVGAVLANNPKSWSFPWGGRGAISTYFHKVCRILPLCAALGVASGCPEFSCQASCRGRSGPQSINYKTISATLIPHMSSWHQSR